LCLKVAVEAREIGRKIGKKIFQIMGGPHCTFAPEVLSGSALDAIGVGECDVAWVELLSAMSAGRSIDDIPNIVTQSNFHRVLIPSDLKRENYIKYRVANTMERTCRDPVNHVGCLDHLPFLDWRLFLARTSFERDNSLLKRTIMTRRGCPYPCTYCFNRVQNALYSGQKTIHNYSIDRVIAECKEVSHQWPTEFWKIYDDNAFFSSKGKEGERLREFAEKWRDEIDLPFFVLIRADIAAKDPEILRLLKKAGCKSITMSIESGSKYIREKLLERNMSDEQIISSHHNAWELGIVNFSNRNPACYHPQNYSQTFSGPVVMKEALARSINVPAVQTLYLAGLNNTIETVSKLGITTLNDPSRLGLSLVLGGGEVRLVELTGAYAALAADGVYRKPVSVLRVENAAGEVLEEYKDDGVQAVDPREVRIINDILSSVELRSGLFSASLPLTQVPGHQVALKTGTTNDYVDAWAFGYTPNLAVGVWAGNNNRDSLTSRGSSILAAVPMWHSFASKALAGKPLSTFERPVPIVSSNPVLNGKLIEGSLHTILYYLGRRDDPQFPNWETGVQSWLQTNSVDRRKFELVDESSIENPPAEGKIEIEPISPENGSFVSGPVDARFRIISEKDISSIEVYLNGGLVGQTSDVPHRDFTYGVEIDQGLLVLQNSIVVRVTDEDGLRGEESIIVFK